jgi:hypothetical protein
LILFDGTYRLQRRGSRNHARRGNAACAWRLRVIDFAGDNPGAAYLRPCAVIATLDHDSPFRVTCAESMGRRVLADFDLAPDKLIWIEHFPEEDHRMVVGIFTPQPYSGTDRIHTIDWRPIRDNELAAIRPYLKELE